MPEGMGLGMAGQTPWGRAFAGMQNSMTFPGAGFRWSSMGPIGMPPAQPNPVTQAQPGPTKADMGGMQQAFGDLQAQQAGKMASDGRRALDTREIRQLLGGFPGLYGASSALKGTNGDVWAGIKAASALQNFVKAAGSEEVSDLATRVRGGTRAAGLPRGAAQRQEQGIAKSAAACAVLSYLEKTAAPAWVRQIQRGLLSPQAVHRVASSLPAGKFRFLSNLGRGQFNVADKVVGNVGGHAGEMVRKLPSHAYTDASLAYTGLKPFVDRVNRLVPTRTGKPLVAPYLETGSKGAFQRLGNEDVGELPMSARHYLSDLHDGNLGPRGQVLDFAVQGHGLGWAPKAARRVSDLSIDPTIMKIPGGADLATMQPANNMLNRRINNAVRNFYHAPADVRQRFPGVTNISPEPTTVTIPSQFPETAPYRPRSSATKETSPLQRIGLGLLGTAGAGGLSSAALNKQGNDMNAIDQYLLKTAAQDNDAPQRSATGESQGLTYQQRDDDYAQGQAAWEATSKYFKGGAKLRSEPNPFKGKHRGEEKKAKVHPLRPVNEDPDFIELLRKHVEKRSCSATCASCGHHSAGGCFNVCPECGSAQVEKQGMVVLPDGSAFCTGTVGSKPSKPKRPSKPAKPRVKRAKAVSKAQQKFMGMVHATQTGEIRAPSKAVAEAAGSMSHEDAEDFASTKRKGLPGHKKQANLAAVPGVKDGAKTSDSILLRQAIIAELDASNLYDQMAGSTSNPKLRKILKDVSQEEKVHVGEFTQLLNAADGENEESLDEGETEAAKKAVDNTFWCAQCKCPRRKCGCACETTEKKAYVGPTALSMQAQMPSPAAGLIQRILATRKQRLKSMGSEVTMLDKNASMSPVMPARLISRLVPLNIRREDEELEPDEQEGVRRGHSQAFPELFQTDATPIPSLMASPAKQGLMAGAAGGLLGGGLGYGAGKLAERFAGTGEHSGPVGALVGGLGGATLAGLARLKGQRKRNEHLEEIMRRLPPGATKHDYVNTEMLWESLMNRFGGEKISGDQSVGPFARAFLRRCLEHGLSLEQIKEGIDQVEVQFGKEASDELYAGLEKIAAPIPWGQLAGKAMGWGSKALGGLRNMAGKGGQMFNKAVGGQGGRMAAGAMTGYTAAHDPSNAESSMFNPMSWGGREWAGALGGAAYGRAMPRFNPAFQAAGRRAFGGMMAGNTLGYATDMAGLEGVGDQLGRAGAVGGFASPFVKGLKPGAMGPKMEQAGNTFNQVFMKPWEKATGLNPKSVWRGIADKTAPAAERAGMALGPGMITAGLGGTAAAVGKEAYNNHVASLKQQFGDEAVSRVSQAAPQIFQQVTGFSPEQAKAMAGSAQGLSQLMNIGDPIFKMLGMDPAQMSGIQKIMLLLGGGALLGGLFTGSGSMSGLGGLALMGGLLPSLGGFPGLGGGQAPPQPAMPQGNAGMTRDPATGTMRPTPYLNTTQPQPRNELTAQQAAATRGKPQMAPQTLPEGMDNQAILS